MKSNTIIRPGVKGKQKRHKTKKHIYVKKGQ